MPTNIIYYGLLFIAALIGFLLQKYVFPGLDKIFYTLDPESLDGLSRWAIKLCRAAKNMTHDLQTNSDRRKWVLDQITALCQRFKIDITEEQKRALLEAAYDEMNAQDSAQLAAEVKAYTAELDTTIDDGR